MNLAVVLVLLCASPQDAPLRSPEPAMAPAAQPPLEWPNFVVPALENIALSFGFLAFSNLVTHEEFALITSETALQNLKLSSWTIDTDRYATNQLGHAYQGALQFQAARTSGLGFWWSALFTTTTSVIWEIFFESEPPSVNDQWMTPIAGSLLGEAAHRAALQLREGEGPRWLSLIGAWLLDPFGGINGELLGESGRRTRLDPMFMRLRVGVNGHVLFDRGERQTTLFPPQALIGLLLVSGGPWNPESTYEAPLSYFDLRADIFMPIELGGELFLRGMLVGQRFGEAGAWGLFGVYDYAAANSVRASGVALGPGVVFQAEPFRGWYLQTAASIAGSPFAAAGQYQAPENTLRDYHVGVGMQAGVDFRLIRPRVLQLELAARNWLVVGTYILPNGWEAVTWVTAGATVPLWRWLGIGIDFTLSDRRASFEGLGPVVDVGLSGRVFLSVLSEPQYGVAPR